MLNLKKSIKVQDPVYEGRIWVFKAIYQSNTGVYYTASGKSCGGTNYYAISDEEIARFNLVKGENYSNNKKSFIEATRGNGYIG